MVKNFWKVFFSFLAIFVIIFLSSIVLRVLFPCKHIETVEKYCEKFDVDTNLAMALIKAESNFAEDAVSHAGAKGIMQLTDETFDFCSSSLGVKNAEIFNPEDNMHAGIWYLSYLLERYDDDVTNAVAAYNAGASNVDKWLKDSLCSDDGKTLSSIPFDETRNHVDKIKRYTAIYDFLY